MAPSGLRQLDSGAFCTPVDVDVGPLEAFCAPVDVDVGAIGGADPAPDTLSPVSITVRRGAPGLPGAPRRVSLAAGVVPASLPGGRVAVGAGTARDPESPSDSSIAIPVLPVRVGVGSLAPCVPGPPSRVRVGADGVPWATPVARVPPAIPGAPRGLARGCPPGREPPRVIGPTRSLRQDKGVMGPRMGYDSTRGSCFFQGFPQASVDG